MPVATQPEALVRFSEVLSLELDLHPAEARATLSLLLECLPSDALDAAGYLAIESARCRRWVNEILLLIDGERALRTLVR